MNTDDIKVHTTNSDGGISVKTAKLAELQSAIDSDFISSGNAEIDSGNYGYKPNESISTLESANVFSRDFSVLGTLHKQILAIVTKNMEVKSDGTFRVDIQNVRDVVYMICGNATIGYTLTDTIRDVVSYYMADTYKSVLYNLEDASAFSQFLSVLIYDIERYTIKTQLAIEYRFNGKSIISIKLYRGWYILSNTREMNCLNMPDNV